MLSSEYLSNIGVVDAGVRETVAEIEKFYNYDNATAYVVTADHGMTNWGN